MYASVLCVKVKLKISTFPLNVNIQNGLSSSSVIAQSNRFPSFPFDAGLECNVVEANANASWAISS